MGIKSYFFLKKNNVVEKNVEKKKKNCFGMKNILFLFV